MIFLEIEMNMLTYFDKDLTNFLLCIGAQVILKPHTLSLHSPTYSGYIVCVSKLLYVCIKYKSLHCAPLVHRGEFVVSKHEVINKKPKDLLICKSLGLV